jgi:hypothetical protein
MKFLVTLLEDLLFLPNREGRNVRDVFVAFRERRKYLKSLPEKRKFIVDE